ncbi:hypothetical protein PSU4_46340 [Pseudonocardia sulfidoxydans NBRC 16205]|uniref:D-ribose pyranase n=1 Tax=Pseudonocardia sulfidoxydans NBRC 16205 TaxID=1223511 RepID=A0A511DLI9_9PSEU|nr:GNAT family N-acetyltransferase [Pseudonocardia sulfidoxydans]GEL25680.1 hypothetical protein PSU4_46340 [Pseudonocardia sulfidoxydans NBRC 16205]
MIKVPDPRLRSDVLFLLWAMAHGDDVAVVDSSFFARYTACANLHGSVAQLTDFTVAQVVHAVLSAIQLDTTFITEPVRQIRYRDQHPGAEHRIAVQAAVNAAVGFPCPVTDVAPSEFQAQLKNCFAVIVTGDQCPPGAFILRKGLDVAPADALVRPDRATPVTRSAVDERYPSVPDRRILTDRLLVRPWEVTDVAALFALFSEGQVPELHSGGTPIDDGEAARTLLDRWITDGANNDPGRGRWAVVSQESAAVIGAASLLHLPTADLDVHVDCRIAPVARGRGYAAEACRAIAHYAFAVGTDEIFAVLRAENRQGAATANRVGMDWVGQTEKYGGAQLEVYRLRRGDLGLPAWMRSVRPSLSTSSGEVALR